MLSVTDAAYEFLDSVRDRQRIDVNSAIRVFLGLLAGRLGYRKLVEPTCCVVELN
jgi:hypothetical protein